MKVSTLISVHALYKDAGYLGLSTRTIQYWVTEDIIPHPIHIGKEAYYDLSSCPIYDYIRAVKILKDDLGNSLEIIRGILKAKEDDIVNFHAMLVDHMVKNWNRFNAKALEGGKMYDNNSR